MKDVTAYRRGKVGLITESVKLKKVAVDSPPIEPCSLCLDTSGSNGLRYFVTPVSGTKMSINKFCFFFVII